jgi:hypothetical protein
MRQNGGKANLFDIANVKSAFEEDRSSSRNMRKQMSQVLDMDGDELINDKMRSNIMEAITHRKNFNYKTA